MTRFSILADLLLAACGGAVAPRMDGASHAQADTCGAAAQQGLIGLDAAAALAVPEPKRIYRPDEAITQDFNPLRINVQLDETDTIIAVTCG